MKGYGFSSFAKNMGTHATKTVKNLSKKYGQKLLDSAKKSTTDAIKTASKREIQKTAEATGDLISNEIADKKTNASTGLHSKKSLVRLQNDDANSQIEAHKRYVSPEKRQQINDELRLV